MMKRHMAIGGCLAFIQALFAHFALPVMFCVDAVLHDAN